MNEEDLVQKYSYTTQISWYTCWVILIWLIFYTGTGGDGVTATRCVESTKLLYGGPG